MGGGEVGKSTSLSLEKQTVTPSAYCHSSHLYTQHVDANFSVLPIYVFLLVYLPWYSSNPMTNDKSITIVHGQTVKGWAIVGH